MPSLRAQLVSIGGLIFCSFVAALLTGCTTPKTTRPPPPLPSLADLQAKAGLTPAEWDELLSPVTQDKARTSPPTPIGLEFLRPGVIVIYLADLTYYKPGGETGEVHAERKDGRWVLQSNVLSESDRRRGRFLTPTQFEQFLIANETDLQRQVSGQGKPLHLDFPFEDYVGKLPAANGTTAYMSWLPSLRGWRYLVEQLHYTDDVFVLQEARFNRKAVALKLDGEFRYLINGAFDFINHYAPAGLTKKDLTLTEK